MNLRVGERLAEVRESRKKCMSHANESVRLAGLTDDLIVRDQLLDLAQEWMLAARRARRPSDDARVVSLHKATTWCHCTRTKTTTTVDRQHALASRYLTPLA